jgi:hypothetical protein
VDEYKNMYLNNIWLIYSLIITVHFIHYILRS